MMIIIGEQMKFIPIKIIIGLLLSMSWISAQSVNFSIKIEGQLKTISPYIYGTNDVILESDNYAALRQGGNRMTGYNWENNASNAGSDYLHSSDNYLTWSAGITGDDENIPGIVTTKFQDDALEIGANYSLVTLQMAGFVAKDKDKAVTVEQTAPSSRWDRVSFSKDSAFSLVPDLTDTNVYMDEYVNFLVNRYGKANEVSGVKGYSLDNEPALWPSTHPRIHPLKTTCQEIVQKAIDLSKAVKNIDEYAEIFGPALYGFSAYTTFQDAPDWTTVSKGKTYSWFIDYYLDEMKKAETANGGKRLLDVLDVHWYPEAIGDQRITNSGSTSDKDIAARLQAPRTLWDTKYTENSWIGQYGKAHLPLIPKMLASINKYYPGTKLAFTEITYGGNNHISDGIAMADAIGIMAKYGVYYVALWPTTNQTNFISSAYKIFRNYDGNKSTFGDYYATSITSDSVNTSVYGSITEGSNEIHIIAINKYLTKSCPAEFSITTDNINVLSGKVWAFDASNPVPKEITAVSGIQNNSFSYFLPAGSVCHFVLKTSSTLSDINENRIGLKHDFKLEAFPNPFNPSCQIEYSTPSSSNAVIQIFSITGEVVKTFDQLSATGHVTWNGTNNNNEKVSSGVYCAILKDDSHIYLTKKLMLLK
jgi:mannan endo-1,4-beta-mannosidase